MISVRRTVEQIVETVGGTGGRPVFGGQPVRPREHKVEVYVDETARVLRLRATTSLEDGLVATVAWFRDHRVRQASRALSERPDRPEPLDGGRAHGPECSYQEEIPCRRSTSTPP